jgi:DNA (cytosine-5)-methyltransferase 1
MSRLRRFELIHYGDITKIDGGSVPVVDIITGGSPCQDLSIAGKRAGLAGERSGLFMEQIRIIKEMRENDRRTTGGADSTIRPRWMVWENVPGAFSSNGGEDFRAVLEETAKVAQRDARIPRLEGGVRWPSAGCIMGTGWSIAWRVHDAQFWGVPQRRKRIALVADFGGETAPEILFEREGVPGNTEPSSEEGQGIARDVTDCSGEAISFLERAGCEGGGKGILIQHERVATLSTFNNQSVLRNISV